ncbi:MAG: extracellular solute-binding protein [Chitinivibrionales bacterium]|nr:extracellular solute-binding protein [Chitinivibrionales bacterium]MBD3396682.1 extracellular solute-binding protein [Chitinivibrionales bacterium]
MEHSSNMRPPGPPTTYPRAARWCVLLFLALVLRSGCRASSDEELIVISPHSPEIREEFSRGFARWYAARTGNNARIRWLDVGGTGESIEYIRSRNAEKKQAGGVDVFFGGGNFPFIKLTRQDLLARHVLPDSLLARIPPDINGAPIHGADSLWYGAAVSGFGIIYNKAIAGRNGLAVPSRWIDLADPACHGWVSSGDPRYSGSIHMMYEILLQAYGWDRGWEVISRMGANVQTFAKGASSAAKAVSLGQAAFGLAIDFYAFIEIERYGRDRLGFVLPDSETVVSADGIGILKNAPSPGLAHSFLDYVLGEGQKLWVLKPGLEGGPAKHALCRFPVDSTLYSVDKENLTVTRNPFALESALPYDARLGGTRWSILGDLIAAFILIPHEELKACFRETVRRGMTDEASRKYFRIELDEQEALSLAVKWGDRDFALERVRLMNEWTRMAQKRYGSVIGSH